MRNWLAGRVTVPRWVIVIPVMVPVIFTLVAISTNLISQALGGMFNIVQMVILGLLGLAGLRYLFRRSKS